MKVAIIGCGNIANAAHIPAYLKNEKAEIKYFCDILPERAEAAVEKYGCGTAITDYHDILRDPEVQAVSVCTPNKVHPLIAMDCLKAGKNVLCEKPAARTYKEAMEMQKVQHETGKVRNILSRKSAAQPGNRTMCPKAGVHMVDVSEFSAVYILLY